MSEELIEIAPEVIMNLRLSSHDKYLMRVQRDADHTHYEAQLQKAIPIIRQEERERDLSYWHTQLTHMLKTSTDLTGDIGALVQSIEGEWMALRKKLSMSIIPLKEQE